MNHFWVINDLKVNTLINIWNRKYALRRKSHRRNWAICILAEYRFGNMTIGDHSKENPYAWNLIRVFDVDLNIETKEIWFYNESFTNELFWRWSKYRKKGNSILLMITHQWLRSTLIEIQKQKKFDSIINHLPMNCFDVDQNTETEERIPSLKTGNLPPP
jgi:hypothetical protein